MKIDSRDGGLAVVTMDEGKANAISPALLAELSRVLDELERQSCAGLVITGAGKHFSAGLDLATVSALAPADLDRFLADFERVFERFFLLPFPVIACVNGNAIAGGCILAAAADRVVAAEGEYRIGANEVRIGVTCPSVVTDILRARLAPAPLHQVLLHAELHSPQAALALGLVDELVAPEDLAARSEAVARAWMKSPPSSYGAMKRELRARFLDPHRAQYAASRAAFASLWQSPPAVAARAAVLGKK